MSSDRDDTRKVSAERPEDAPVVPPAGIGASLPNALTETRVRHLAQHLAMRGRLNMHVLAAEWGVSRQDLMTWLSVLHRQGRFERLDRAPYFRVIEPERRRGEH